MGQSIKKCKILQLAQYETDNLKYTVSVKEIKFIINQFPKRKYLDGSGGCTEEFYQMVKEELTVLHNLFKKMDVKGTVPNLFCEVNITLLTNQTKVVQKRKL